MDACFVGFAPGALFAKGQFLKCRCDQLIDGATVYGIDAERENQDIGVLDDVCRSVQQFIGLADQVADFRFDGLMREFLALKLSRPHCQFERGEAEGFRAENCGLQILQQFVRVTYDMPEPLVIRTTRANDLAAAATIGGVAAWSAAGLAIDEYARSHLDTLPSFKMAMRRGPGMMNPLG
jgi:hypothetical protein